MRWQSAKDEMPPDADTLEAIDAALEMRAREGSTPMSTRRAVLLIALALALVLLVVALMLLLGSLAP